MQGKGKYIILEGGDGCGKSTQAKLLVTYLNQKGITTIQGREPGTAKVGEQIREILLNKENDLEGLTEIFLFEAARTEFFRKDLMPKIERGVNVVADRSCFSTLAYQGYGEGLSLRLIEQLNELATFPLTHDLAFIIDVEASKGLSKEQNADRFAAKGGGYHERVNQGFREIARTHPNIVIIRYRDGDINGTQEEIRSHVDKLF